MFIDNDGVRENLVRGFSDAEHHLPMLMKMSEFDCLHPSFIWFTRVQTHANLADGPSRLCFDTVMTIDGMKVIPARHDLFECFS